jgi:ABC-2 type transport system ATP-binding protein
VVCAPLVADNLGAMASVVELRAARKRFGEVEAVKGVDLVIGTGELVALLGPNGAGKTTSISLMLGLRRPTAGEARLFGLDPEDRRARSRCGVMLQESGTTGVLTVREIVDLFRSYYPSPLSTARAIALAGLDAKAGARIGTLSGGERQRLYFALAVCGDPEALFLDEPTVGMDVEARRGVLESIRALSNAGKTIVLTTHYLEEADQLAHRIVVIDHGIVIADATPREIKARIPSKRVNFRSATVLGESTFSGLSVQSLEIRDGRVHLLSNEPEAVLRGLFERGVVVHDLEVTGADLEEAFLSMTRRT